MHHERPDGTGYPQGLTADGISEGAKVLGVADAFDAMTQRPPIPAWACEGAGDRNTAGRVRQAV
jgi:HD-GYP domain-containing protein (c-di-GMP phosphodiesterase class II)